MVGKLSFVGALLATLRWLLVVAGVSYLSNVLAKENIQAETSWRSLFIIGISVLLIEIFCGKIKDREEKGCGQRGEDGSLPGDLDRLRGGDFDREVPQRGEHSNDSRGGKKKFFKLVKVFSGLVFHALGVFVVLSGLWFLLLKISGVKDYYIDNLGLVPLFAIAVVSIFYGMWRKLRGKD